MVITTTDTKAEGRGKQKTLSPSDVTSGYIYIYNNIK